MTAATYDKKLLACHGEVWQRVIISDEDKPFVDYLSWFITLRSATFMRFARLPRKHLLKCKAFAMPPKPSSTLSNLTTHNLSEDVIGLIGSFDQGVHCQSCWLINFNMRFLEKCRRALTIKQEAIAARVRREVEEEGGTCQPMEEVVGKERTLHNCMTSPKANQVAICGVETNARNQLLINATERRIKQDVEFIKKKQEGLKVSHDVLGMRKQNGVYLKQIFEDP